MDLDEEIYLRYLKAIESKNPDDIADLQHLRAQRAPGVYEATYYQKYIELCEKFVNGNIPLGPRYRKWDEVKQEYIEPELDPSCAQHKLKELNEQYQCLVRAGTIKQNLIATVLANNSNEGWAASDIC